MNVAKPLEPILEDETSLLPEGAFSLPAREFVEAWADALGLSEAELPAWDRETLAGEIRRGTNRLRIVEALRGHRSVAGRSLWSERHDIRRPPDRHALLDLMIRFAPQDDAAFVRFAFSRLCDREPSAAERLELEFDLRGGRRDREAAIRHIAAIAQREGHLALLDSLRPEMPASEPTDARLVPAGFAVGAGGEQSLVFAREMPDNGGWWVGPDVMRQDVRVVDGGWTVEEGWLIVGPKRSLSRGDWRLDLDLLQPQTSVLALDVVANSGLDVLLRFRLVGPFAGTILVPVAHDHRFVELRLEVPAGQGPGWLKPRNISLSRLP